MQKGGKMAESKLNLESVKKWLEKCDYVEVVRCKDCKNAHMTSDGRYAKFCDAFTDDDGDVVEVYFESDFYCGFAERRQT